MLISLYRVTSWFDTVYNVVTRWMNFRKKQLHEHELQIRAFEKYIPEGTSRLSYIVERAKIGQLREALY